jgi:hypothetical protein
MANEQIMQFIAEEPPEDVPDEADDTVEITLPRSELKATIGLFKKELRWP